jgi:UDP-hydrolysing UDP-N-acetyl-D-glucosamine 2-epimerase
MKRKICVVITARPSYSRIKTALQAIEAHPEMDLQIVAAASALLDRYGNVVDDIVADGFRVDACVHNVVEGSSPVTAAKTTGLGMIELSGVFDRLKPDAVVTIADRYETMATAVAAAYMNLPLVHIQGGEITGSIDEKVRHSITKLSDVHCVATGQAAEYVIRMGEEPGTVHVTGCPSIDLAAEILDQPELDFDPLEKYGGVGAKLDLHHGYIVVMQHPVTTEHHLARTHVTETLYAVRDAGLQALWFWPNVDAGSDGTSRGIRSFREREPSANIHYFKNMHPPDFLRLLYNSRCIIGNSSVAIRECSFLGVPAVNIGTRQAGRERGGNVIDVDYSRSAILAALQQHLGNGRPAPNELYGNGRAGERIAEVLATADLRFEKRLAYGARESENGRGRASASLKVFNGAGA